MAKLLVQARGSVKDPSYAEQGLTLRNEEVSFLEFFHRQGIGTLEKDLVRSVHGNSELTLRTAREIQELSDEGHQVVVTAAGGLLWALPSYFAANMPTVPVIGIPNEDAWWNGLAAFMNPVVPSGVACVGGVGLDRYDVAANVAKEILTNEFRGVYTYKGTDKLNKKLEELGVEVIDEVSKKDPSDFPKGLVVGSMGENFYDEIPGFEAYGSVGIFTPPDSRIVFTQSQLNVEGVKFMHEVSEYVGKSVWTRGEDNVAYLAAKFVAAYMPEVRAALYAAAENKRNSYDGGEISLESFVGLGGSE